jgi:hypothetical protein
MPISNLTKEELEKFAKESTNWKELMTKCGYTNFGCTRYLVRKLNSYDISTSHFVRNKIIKRYTNEEIFIENSKYTSMACIKHKLMTQYNWKYECSSCKLSEWMGQKIQIEIDHINGVHTDNRIENLRFLCPNCHALTDTYKGRNLKNKEQYKEIYENIKIKKTCNNCGNKKYEYSEYCKDCHININIRKNNINLINGISNKCKDCNKDIQKESERCLRCYRIAKTNGIFEKGKEKKNINNMKKCPDCDNLISKTSTRCRLCHYALMRTISETHNKTVSKGQCIDCNSNINKKAVRCVPCSNKVIETANKSIKNECKDCKKEIWNTSVRCVDCHLIHTRKVERPSYEQLLKDKETLTMLQIGKKYGVSDNAIRKWIKKYKEKESSSTI